jgi:hypothetical protein
MERVRWTDERLDERMTAMDQKFDRVFTEFDRVHAEIRDLRADFNRFQDRMVQIAFALVGVLLAQVVALTIALA